MTDKILSRMLSAKLPCYCATKATEHQLHDEDCLYRLVRDAVAEIEKLRAEAKRQRPTEAAPAKLHAENTSWVRLMCYFGTDGVWNSADETADLSALPFSQGLIDDVAAWRASVIGSAAEAETFSTRALSLARRIKSEQPHWKVIYVDRTKSGPDIRSKDTVEIEITL